MTGIPNDMRNMSNRGWEIGAKYSQWLTTSVKLVERECFWDVLRYLLQGKGQFTASVAPTTKKEAKQRDKPL